MSLQKYVAFELDCDYPGCYEREHPWGRNRRKIEAEYRKKGWRIGRNQALCPRHSGKKREI